jgi:hypothetical protein
VNNFIRTKIIKANLQNYNKYSILKYTSIKYRSSNEKTYITSNIIISENTIYFLKYNNGFILDLKIDINSKTNFTLIQNTKNIRIQTKEITIEIKSELGAALYNLLLKISNK